MPKFSADGATIHYEVSGSGPPLLLIAGIASDSSSWRPLAPLLSRRFTVIALDNRGSGRSLAAGPLAIPNMVADCAALLDHLGFPVADVVGHSMGGMIGLRLAAGHPARVRRLVTMTAGGRIGAKERALFHEMERLYSGGMQPQRWFRLLFQWLFSEPFFASDGMVAAAAEASSNYPFRQSPADFARQIDAVESMAALDRPAVQCPVLAIAAGLDILTPVAAVRAAHEGIADLRVMVIDNAAHSIHWEAPEAVAAAIIEFLT
jgi:aminoacrylate hydrolase